MAIDFAELKVRICEALGHIPGVSVDTNGFYYSKCEKDYRDELEDSQIADILAGRHRCITKGVETVENVAPMDALNFLLAEGYQEELWRLEDEVLEEVKKHADVVSFIEENRIDDDSLKDCLCDVWYATVPVDDYLEQDVCMDIMLDTGDCNYEFTCNNLASSDIKSVEDFDDSSSLLWLCEQQGVTREELLAAFDKGTAHSDEVNQLWARQKELVAELKKFGFKEPRFGERVWHSGAYQEFVRLREALGTKEREVNRLQAKYRDNDFSYEEYLKKHFERFERLDPMSPEQFEVKKAEVLANLSARLEKVKAELADIQKRLVNNLDFGKIAELQSEHKDVMLRIGELSKTDEYKKAEFIDSVHNEILNASSVGVVIFLVKTSLGEAIRLQEVVQAEESINHSYYYEKRDGKSSFVLDKSVRCGLMDDCSGGGSVFEIKLLKDVEIPVKALYRAVPDLGNGNYGFREIYGMNDEEFVYGLKEIREVVPEKVEDLIAAATDKCDSANKTILSKDNSLYEKE